MPPIRPPVFSRIEVLAREAERRRRRSAETLVSAASVLWQARAALLATRRALLERHSP